MIPEKHVLDTESGMETGFRLRIMRKRDKR
jgi:hypothetical protein